VVRLERPACSRVLSEAVAGMTVNGENHQGGSLRGRVQRSRTERVPAGGPGCRGHSDGGSI